MLNKYWKLLSRFAVVINLAACGGGGGGGNNTAALITPDASTLPALVQSMNTHYSASQLSAVGHGSSGTIPTDYGTVTFSYGNLSVSNSAANKPCVIARHVARSSTGASNPSVSDAQMAVFCQSGNTYVESSTTLFGGPQYINGNYGVVADLNGDGVDDIFVMETWDGDNGSGGVSNYTTYISNGAGYTKTAHNFANPYQLTTNVQLVAADLTNHSGSGQAGCKDVIAATGFVFVNDCAGNFTLQGLNFSAMANDAGDYGTGVCVGNFDGTGTKIVITDSMSPNTGASQQNSVLTVDSSLNVTARTILPVPYFDTVYPTGITSSSQHTHNFLCTTVNNLTGSGYDDIVIAQRPWSPAAVPTWDSESFLQVIAFNGTTYVDKSSTTFPNYPTNTASSYSVRFATLPSGKLAAILDGGTYSGSTHSGNQLWIRTGAAGTPFTPVFTTELNSIYNAAGSANGGVYGGNILSMVPLQNANGTWDYLELIENNSAAWGYFYSNTQIVFK
jgi:hypothetical protein